MTNARRGVSLRFTTAFVDENRLGEGNLFLVVRTPGIAVAQGFDKDDRFVELLADHGFPF
jgi:hypothetical protein